MGGLQEEVAGADRGRRGRAGLAGARRGCPPPSFPSRLAEESPLSPPRLRAQFALPGGGNGRTPVAWPELISGLGYDPEKAIFSILNDLRFRGSFRQYARLRWSRHGERFFFDIEEGPPMLEGPPVGGENDPTNPGSYGIHFDPVTGMIKHPDRKTPLARAHGQVKI